MRCTAGSPRPLKGKVGRERDSHCLHGGCGAGRHGPSTSSLKLPTNCSGIVAYQGPLRRRPQARQTQPHEAGGQQPAVHSEQPSPQHPWAGTPAAGEPFPRGWQPGGASSSALGPPFQGTEHPSGRARRPQDPNSAFPPQGRRPVSAEPGSHPQNRDVHLGEEPGRGQGTGDAGHVQPPGLGAPARWGAGGRPDPGTESSGLLPVHSLPQLRF